MKKILSVILTLSVILLSLPLSVVTASAETDGYYTYSVSNGKAEITDVDESISGSLSIPSTLGGYPVTSIGEKAFYYCYRLTSVNIPDSVTSIGDYAFNYCDSLASVTIGSSVTSIGIYAFFYCTSLTSVTIPDSVTSIGDKAFCWCSSLTSVTIPDSVTSIGDLAFSFCSSLTSIEVSENNQNYSSVDGVLFNKDKTELICYPAGKTNENYTISDSVTSIGNCAFRGCDSLTSVTIPDSVTSIGYEAFYGCTSLTSVTIPDSVISIGEYAFSFCDSLTSVTIGNSVTSIGDGAFSSCDSLKTVYYRGSQTDRNNITIGSYNEDMTGATWYYNSCIGSAEHNIVNGKCTVCEPIEFTPGDCNGDGNVDTTDLASLKLFLAAISDLSDTGKLGADLNGDSNVDTTDLATLKLKLAGIE